MHKGGCHDLPVCQSVGTMHASWLIGGGVLEDAGPPATNFTMCDKIFLVIPYSRRKTWSSSEKTWQTWQVAFLEAVAKTLSSSILKGRIAQFSSSISTPALMDNAGKSGHTGGGRSVDCDDSALRKRLGRAVTTSPNSLSTRCNDLIPVSWLSKTGVFHWCPNLTVWLIYMLPESFVYWQSWASLTE